MIKENEIPNITKEMISACETLLIAKAYEGTIREVVENYENKILKENVFNREERRSNGNKPDRITDQKDAWLMSNDDFLIYNALCKKERDKAGLKVDDDDFCPLLVAEGLTRKAREAFIDIMKPISGIGYKDIIKLEHYKKVTDLNINLVSYYHKFDSKKILEKVKI